MSTIPSLVGPTNPQRAVARWAICAAGILLPLPAPARDSHPNSEAPPFESLSSEPAIARGELNVYYVDAGDTALPLTSWSGLTRLAGQVSSVAERQIEELNAQDLPSALRRTPGVVISRHNAVGSFGGGDGGAVFIRGMGISRPGAEIQTCMDGIPRFAGVWTHPILDTLSVDNVQRLDVFKGAQPVLYGNMAFGVVDLVTKRRTEPGAYTELNLGYGSYDTVMESAEHGAKIGPLDYYLVQSFRQSDGHRPFSGGQLENYLFRAGYDLNEFWNASVLYHRTGNTSEDPGDIRTGIRQGEFQTDTDFAVVTFAHQDEKADGYVKFYWDSGAIDWVDQYNTVSKLNNVGTFSDWDNYGIRARETFRPWEGGEFTIGHDLDYVSGHVVFHTPPAKDVLFPRETYRISQPYCLASQRIDLREKVWLKPSAGVRGFFHDTFDDEAGPQAGVVLNVDHTKLHASYAHGVNYPGIFVDTLSKTFMPGNNRQDELTAETVDHFEYGIAQDIGKNLTIELTGFYDSGKNRIVTVPPPPFPPVWDNIGEFDTRGFELSSTWRVSPDLALFGGGTYLVATPGNLPYTPEWAASFGASYRFWEHFLLSLDGSLVDDQIALTLARPARTNERIDSYFLLGARLAYDFQIPEWEGAKGEVYLSGENLTDTDYEYKPGYPMPGANLMVGCKLSF